MSYTKNNRVEELAENTDINKKEATIIVRTFQESMVESLQDSEKIEIRGFGRFQFSVRKARTGRNPKTGKLVSVKEKKIVYFKPGKEIKLNLRI